MSTRKICDLTYGLHSRETSRSQNTRNEAFRAKPGIIIIESHVNRGVGGDAGAARRLCLRLQTLSLAALDWLVTQRGSIIGQFTPRRGKRRQRGIRMTQPCLRGRVALLSAIRCIIYASFPKASCFRIKVRLRTAWKPIV